MQGAAPARQRLSRRSWAVVALGAALWPRPAWAAVSDQTYFGVLLLLAAVAAGYVLTHFAGSRLTERFGLGEGVEYVVVGVVLGPVLGIIDGQLAKDLRPIVSLGAGALGMVAGLELFEGQRGFPGVFVAGLGIAVCTAVMVIGVPLGAAWAAGYEITASTAWSGALLVAGVVAIGAEGSHVTRIARAMGARGSLPARGERVARWVNAFTLVGFGVLFAVLVPSSEVAIRSLPEAGASLGLQIGAGMILALLLWLVVVRRVDERALLTIAVGAVLLGCGLAYATQLSPLFVNFVVGLVFSRISTRSGDLYRMLGSIRRPFEIALLFFAGLEWTASPPLLYPLVIVPFLVLRWLGRRAGGFAGARPSGGIDFGRATAAPGVLVIALMLNLRLVYPDVPGLRAVYGPLLVAVLCAELFAPRTLRRWLIDVTDVPTKKPRARESSEVLE